MKTLDRTIVPIPLSSIPRGQSAKKQSNAKGMIRLEEQVDAEINVLELPPGEDPDEVIKENPSLWDYRVSHPIPLMDYFFKEETADLNLREPAGKTEAAKRLCGNCLV
ncbi:MAG: hypothetical protein E6J31_12445 [Chloroflexi bacterium]|nr:MAG: hypothetical protein E6J31_12445 [Chloroflexota bacterium]